MPYRNKRVFISFDFDNDQALKTFIRGQANNLQRPFQITDFSLKEEQPERNWEAKARAQMKQSDLVIVMLGRRTDLAPGVRKEVRIAREEGVDVAQVIGYRDGTYQRVPDAGIVYRWNDDNLKRLLAPVWYTR